MLKFIGEAEDSLWSAQLRFQLRFAGNFWSIKREKITRDANVKAHLYSKADVLELARRTQGSSMLLFPWRSYRWRERVR